MKKICFILMTIFISAGVLQAQKPEIVTTKKPGWHKIGDATVDYATDRDQFIVLGRDRFKAVQIKVQDAPLHLVSMEIFYDGGGKENVLIRSDFNAGGSSREIPLKNGSAELKKVVFVYKTMPNTGTDKAKVELWGKK